MSSAIFQRGQLDTTQSPSIGYYLTGVDHTGAYSIWQYAPSTADAQTHAVFGSTKYVIGSQWNPVIVFLSPNSDGTYQLSAAATPGGSPTPLFTSTYNGSNNVVDVATAGQTPAKFAFTPIPNVGTQGLWSGVWYQAGAGGSTGGVYGWKVMPRLNATGNFRGITGTGDPASVTGGYFQLMLVPRDAGTKGSIAVWNNGACQTPSGDPNIALVLWSQWVDGDPGAPQGCDGPAWLIGPTASTTAQDCIFTSAETCAQGYLYTLCGTGSSCGACLGPCVASGGTTPVCSHDYNPSIETAGTSPLSCTPKNPTPVTFWERYKWWIILAIVIVGLLLIAMIVAVLELFHHRKPPPPPAHHT